MPDPCRAGPDPCQAGRDPCRGWARPVPGWARPVPGWARPRPTWPGAPTRLDPIWHLDLTRSNDFSPCRGDADLTGSDPGRDFSERERCGRDSSGRGVPKAPAASLETAERTASTCLLRSLARGHFQSSVVSTSYGHSAAERASEQSKGVSSYSHAELAAGVVPVNAGACQLHQISEAEQEMEIWVEHRIDDHHALSRRCVVWDCVMGSSGHCIDSTMSLRPSFANRALARAVKLQQTTSDNPRRCVETLIRQRLDKSSARTCRATQVGRHGGWHAVKPQGHGQRAGTLHSRRLAAWRSWGARGR
ncbi:unnamed protein product [Lampetra planeri]